MDNERSVQVALNDFWKLSEFDVISTLDFEVSNSIECGNIEGEYPEIFDGYIC